MWFDALYWQYVHKGAELWYEAAKYKIFKFSLYIVTLRVTNIINHSFLFNADRK